MTGTSMAAPHAAGVAALLISAAPTLSGNPTGIEVLLQQSAVPKTTTNTCGGIPAGAVPNNTAGWGRIDALAAYNLAVAPNSPPTVELSSPADGAVFPAFATVALDTDVSDDGLVARVDFFAGSQRIATDMTAPFSFDWVLPPSGAHVLTAVATDDQGASTISPAVSITVEPSGSLLPPPWAHADVGAVGVPGDAGYSAGTFSVAGSGGGIGGTSDKFHFAFQQVSGDVQIVARLAGMQNEIDGSKGGIMIRESLASDSANFALVLTGAGRYQFQRRVTAGGTTSNISGTQAAPAWLKLVRAGDTFTAFRSSNGVAWTSMGSYVVALSEDVHVGLAMSSANNSAAAIATFDSVSVTGSVANSPPGVAITSPQDGAAFADPASVTIQADASDPGGAVARVDFFDGASLLGTDTSPPYAFTWPAPPAGAHVLTARATDDLGATATSSAVDISVSYSAGGALPAPWVDADVGAVGIAGDTGHSAGTFSVSASGGGIGGTSDQFHYVSQAASGGLQIVARVTGIQGSSPGARAGVMVRQSLAPDAVNVALLVTGAGRWMFQRRTSAGAKIVYSSGTLAAPVWLKLVRSGNTFTAYRSSNGTTWTSLGSASVSMNGGVTIGLAATSGDNSVLGLSTFDNVAASP
jgi:regulation of enolase protein 1 (concanavalin A-like superfamily)